MAAKILGFEQVFSFFFLSVFIRLSMLQFILKTVAYLCCFRQFLKELTKWKYNNLHNQIR